ncbi:MAG: hypothetical protein WCK58_18415, partial [Chloroflexota bacterium]
RGVAVFAGAVMTLCLPAGIVAALLTLAVLGTARLVDMNGRAAAIATGIGVYPFLFIALEGDLRRLPALGALYLVAAVRFATTTRPRREG